MKLDKVLGHLREGQGIRRKSWDLNKVIGEGSSVTITSIEDFLADDWEVVCHKFYVAINALLEGRCICRIQYSNDPEHHIAYRDKTLYIGLGTCKACKYEFTESDMKAQDWMVVDW